MASKGSDADALDFIALGISSIVRRNLGYTPGLAILAKKPSTLQCAHYAIIGWMRWSSANCRKTIAPLAPAR
jgi:hypothetical protein